MPSFPAVQQGNSSAIVDDQSSLVSSRADRFCRRNSRVIVVLLCVYAAARILFFSAVFPLFNNVDEQYHFGAIQMFAQGHIPGREMPRFDSTSAAIVSAYASYDYLNRQDVLERTGFNVPLFRLPPGPRDRRFATAFAYWSKCPNFEAQSPPLYYVVVAAWGKLGAALGIRDWGLPYWLRFFNSIAYALLVWVSSRFARKLYPENVFLCLSIPALIAVFPQDIFFGMNRDVLSAPLTAIALLLLADALDARAGRYWPLFLGSLAVGLTFLVNLSDWVLYVALGITLLLWARWSEEPRHRKLWVGSISMIAAVALPSVWMLRNYLLIGDLTGSGAKIRDLGWTLKPASDLLRHPLFSLHGMSYFLFQLTATFWRGEFVWHLQPMRWAPADYFYVLSSALLITLFVVDFLRRRGALSLWEKAAGFQALSMIAGSVLFMAGISILFDFHDCFYPSRKLPFLVSGRIISGVLLPFVIVYAAGLELLLRRVRKWIHPMAVLGCLMLFITISEFAVRSKVFHSPYNFFALLR